MPTTPLTFRSAALTFAATLTALVQTHAAEAPMLTRFQNASAPSYVYQRGDVEVVTYEPGADYKRLEELFQESEKAPLAAGPMTTRYYRSKLDGSVQPYGIWLPKDYSREKKYPLVIQLHGTNFKEVLSGSRQKYRGMPGPQWIYPDLEIVCVQPTGLPTTFYQGMGEVDILSVI